MTPGLEHSNLFRKPSVPTFDDVHRNFLQRGGTKEMAQAFYDKWSAVDWYMGHTPITNYAALISRYIANWKANEKPKGSSKLKDW